MEIPLSSAWRDWLSEEISQPYYLALLAELSAREEDGESIYPRTEHIFAALNACPPEEVSVVLLGQDPYYRPSQAMGLSFSVPRGAKIPPSLRRIYQELQHDLDLMAPGHGDLSYWAEQGVLLLNSVLTVREGEPGSHKRLGWTRFTDYIIQSLSEQREHLVYLLWGNYAKAKSDLIDHHKHLILSSAHPSPLAGKAFFHNHHFSQTNAYLSRYDKTPIDWQLPLL